MRSPGFARVRAVVVAGRHAGGRRDRRIRARADVHDVALRLPAGLLPRGGRPGVFAQRRSAGSGTPDRGLGRKRGSDDVRRHADGDQHDRGARHRESPRGLELPVGAPFPVREAVDGAADLGARARQALRHRRHAGRPRDLARLSRVAVVGRALLLPPAPRPGDRRRRDHLPDTLHTARRGSSIRRPAATTRRATT